MPPERRSETQDRTRRALVATARDHFAAHGYIRASIERIAADAGFTRGAVYGNYGGKPGLFLAVLDERLERQVRELDETGGDTPAVRQWRRETTEREAGLALAVQEFRVVALRDGELTRLLRERERRVRRGFAGVIERFAARSGTVLPLPSADMAVVVLALGEGITQAHQLDPDDVDEALFDVVLARLLETPDV